MTENYTLSEVIFSFREHYLELQKKLHDLKYCVSVDPKKIEDIAFDLYQINHLLLMNVTFYKHRNLFQEMMRNILGLFHQDLADMMKMDYGRVEKHLNNTCFIDSKYHIVESNLFTEKVYQILDSEFVRHLSDTSNLAIERKETTKFFLEMYVNSLVITIAEGEKHQRFSEGILRYLPNKDMIQWRCGMSRYDLASALDAPISKAVLSDYQQNLVNSWNKKEIVIPEESRTFVENYEILEEKEQILLKRIIGERTSK